MLIGAALFIDAAPTAISAASAQLRASARPPLPTSSIPTGLAIVDAHGDIAGSVRLADQGLVAQDTVHTIVRIPASAFVVRGGPVMIGISAAQVDTLAAHRLADHVSNIAQRK